MIKIMWVAVLGGAMFLAGPSGESAWAQPRELPARIVTLGGPAELHKKDAAEWAAAGLRAELGEGDSVRTQLGGRITLKTASGQALRLGSRSQLAFLAPEASAASGPTRVRLDNGWLWIAVAPNSPPPTQIEVRAGPGIVTVRGAGVGLRRGPDGSLLVQVHHGTAVCAGPDRQWERTLTGPQELLIPPSGPPGAPAKLTVDKLETTWVRWNVDQDLAGGYGGKKPEP
ncbi:MAG: FecR domain-containing protein [Candidatus Rokuibacteriota bacterium]